MPRLIAVIFTFLCSVEATSCDEPYVLQVGPEFSSNFMIGYLGSFTLDVAQRIGCGTRIQGAKNYNDFLQSVIQRKADIYLVPHHFMPELVKQGFIPVIERHSTTELLYVSQIQDYKNSQFGREKPLLVFTPGPYSVDFYSINHWLKKQNINQTQYTHDTTYASAIMKSIKQPNMVATVPMALYDKIPQSIQKKLHVHASGINLGAYITVPEGTPKALIEAIEQSQDKLASEHWSKPEPVKESKYSRLFSNSFQQLLKPTK